MKERFDELLSIRLGSEQDQIEMTVNEFKSIIKETASDSCEGESLMDVMEFTEWINTRTFEKPE